MTQDEARRSIQQDYREWCHHKGITNPTRNDAFVFYTREYDPQYNAPLPFRYRGNPWNTILPWLLDVDIGGD